MGTVTFAVLASPLLWLSSAHGQQAPWGQSNGVFRTRLTSDKATYAIDEPIKVSLELRNDSQAEHAYQSPGIVFEGELVIQREGQPVRYVSGDFQTMQDSGKLKPGESRVVATAALNGYWDLRQPGRYTIQFPETKTTLVDVDPFGDTVKQTPVTFPASNALEIEVKLPPDGKVPPRDVSARAHLFTRPAGFEVAPWRGVVTNVDWPELPGGVESAAAVLAFASPAEPWPVYEGQETLVIIRLPTGRSTDELTVERAELDGTALRLQVRRRERADEGQQALAYACISLDRLLAPGFYICDVRLVTERREAAKPEADGCQFGFTVSPARAR
jgi:hypothetical protein